MSTGTLSMSGRPHGGPSAPFIPQPSHEIRVQQVESHPAPRIRRGAALTLLLRLQAHLGNSDMETAQAQLDFMLIAEGLGMY